MRTASVLFDVVAGILVAGIAAHLIAEAVTAPTAVHVAARLTVLVCVLGVYGTYLYREDNS